MPGEEWRDDAERVSGYLAQAGEFPHRDEGEGVLLDHVPRQARRVLDLGTGGGRLLGMLLADRPEMRGVGLDFSELMLAEARRSFDGEERAELIVHDLGEPLPALGRFDAVVSSFAIHHLEHERKRALYGKRSSCSSPAASSPTSSTWLRRPSACTGPSSRRSKSRSRTKTPRTARSMSRPS
jgi:SAM-dependent methyltransferase